jgi:alkaline phosphatase D
MTFRLSSTVGPILLLDDIAEGQLALSALFIAPSGITPPPVISAQDTVHPVIIATFDHACLWRARFSLPADRPAGYDWNSTTHDIACDLTGDLRIAYVSCNGEEVGDMEREGSERNAMWARLCDQHRQRPFALLLHGGDQIYADEVTKGHPLSQDWPDRIPRDPSPTALADLRHHLRERFLRRYTDVYAAPEMAWLLARVPSLMQWDDHDICDGWGSLPPSHNFSPVGQTLFSAAREAFLLFQHAATEGDLPRRFRDRAGQHLGWAVQAPGFRLIAPDLRSERTRHSIMGQGGWTMMEAEAKRPVPGHTLLLSSVPLLGPRLSVIEAMILIIPKMQEYEDDLRDQWQSRAHRDEWRRLLAMVRDMARRDGHSLTAISGEIHLATRAEMDIGESLIINQLVASGIAHRAPPKGWARVLGTLATLGEDPLPAHPITIRPLPGQRSRYVAERNYLLLDRQAGEWQARWDLEKSGMTPPLDL